jgi:glutamate synthase domain-containing protein 1
MRIMARESGRIMSVASVDASNSTASEKRSALKSPGDTAKEGIRSTSESAGIDLLTSLRTRATPAGKAKTSEKRSVNTANYQAFRRLCDRLVDELEQADDYLVDGRLSDEGAGMIVEVEQILDELYRVSWGSRECLKRVVVAIRSQINNVQWKTVHVCFMQDIARLLRNTYQVDDSLIKECYKIISGYRLDVFRGTITATEVRKKYRIVEDES